MRGFGVGLGVLLATSALANRDEPVAMRLAKGQSLRIVFYGTSLTATGAWPQQVSQALAKRYEGKAEWINVAMSGKNSDWGLANLDERVMPLNPDVVFLEFAVNDSVKRLNCPLGKAKSNLEKMIGRIRKKYPNVEIVLQTTNPVIDRPEGDSGYRPNLEKYYAMVRKVAAEKGTVLIDNELNWQRILERGPEIYKRLVPDGLHPNANGYAEIATPQILKTLGINQADAVAQESKVFDILVYGGTSAGVMAAVQARRMGKRVLLISPDKHLGGLTSGGLGWTDLGDARTIGGLSREFYNRVYRHYGNAEAWTWQKRETFGGNAQGAPARDDKNKTMWVFEPHVAENIFDDFVAENDIPVVYGKLDLNDGVLKSGNRIVGIRTLDKHRYVALTFIDASYEGDLMAGARISYTVGRESNGQYGETFNGYQRGHATKNQLPAGISAYRKPGNPKSGLLPEVERAADLPDGTADQRIQAYCYRMCLTNVPENRVPISKPRNYRESDYELLFRSIEKGQKSDFFKLDAIPNRKTDSNNSGGLSTDFIGKNYDYPDGNYQLREKIALEHENWQRGLIWTLQNNPRVPESLRKKYAEWGLPKDEFVENGNWPHQLYVREARRMLGEAFLTENSLRDKISALRSVGMGSYKMDSHNVQRIATSDGFVMNEGDVQQSTNGPYGIDFGAMVPKEIECPNLLVPVCLSASHIAYGSIRMEPVFMVLGQSAATAAAMSLDWYIPVQKVDYEKLRARLQADGQVLKLN